MARRAFPTRKPYSTSNFQRTRSDRYWRRRQIGQIVYRFLPNFTGYRIFLSVSFLVSLIQGNLKVPKGTKGYRILNFHRLLTQNLYQTFTFSFSFTKFIFLKGKDPDRRRSAPSPTAEQ